MPPVEIRTSDRAIFRQCRRRWGWTSHLKMNLEPDDAPAGPLWFGTGFHFALEDFHGYNKFGNAVQAFQAYTKAFARRELPEDWEALTELGTAMLSYYVEHWLPRRDRELRTYWLGGKPQVEVQWQLPIPGFDPKLVVYAGRFDRVVTDPFNRLWVCDYKTTSRLDTSRLELDPQISAYTWAANKLYGRPVEGVVLVQFVKAVPDKPARLVNGEFSQNKRQNTTYSIYRKALLDVFGTVPTRYENFLHYLMSMETPEGDLFIRRDLVRRNEYFVQAEEWKIQAEAADMLNPDLPLYPNPTRDCVWSCPFRTPCIALDDGSDVEFLLRDGYRPKLEVPDWRKRLFPDES